MPVGDISASSQCFKPHADSRA